jgi:hypothetical protein
MTGEAIYTIGGLIGAACECGATATRFVVEKEDLDPDPRTMMKRCRPRYVPLCQAHAGDDSLPIPRLR